MWRIFLIACCCCLMCCGVQVGDVFSDASGETSSDGDSSSSGGTAASSPTTSAASSSGSGDTGGALSASGDGGSGGSTPGSSGGSSADGGAGGSGGGPACVCGNLFPCAEAHCAAECPNATGCLDTYPYVCSDSPDTCDPCVERFCRCFVNACVENP